MYQAPNRAHDLRLYFDEGGVEVLDRSGEGAPTLLRLELSRWGRVGDWHAASPGRLRAEANRLELEREGLREWYVNSESGVEQGWVVSQRPEGDGPLVLGQRVSGASLTATAGGVKMRSAATGRMLRYDHVQGGGRSGRVVAGEARGRRRLGTGGGGRLLRALPTDGRPAAHR